MPVSLSYYPAGPRTPAQKENFESVAEALGYAEAYMLLLDPREHLPAITVTSDDGKVLEHYDLTEKDDLEKISVKYNVRTH